MGDPPERTSPPPPLPIRVVGKALTRMVARAPWTWPLLRRSVTGFFDRSAGGWDERVRPDAPEHLAALAAAVARLKAPPANALDLGTGTGAGALWLARQFPNARVTGLDISEAMIEQAKAKLPNELSGRVEFLVGDAERLPFPDGSLDLVAQISVPVFFDEVARVLAPRGHVVVVSSLGLKTPFHTPERTLRDGFRRRGIETVATGAEGPGTFFLGRARPEANGERQDPHAQRTQRRGSPSRARGRPRLSEAIAVPVAGDTLRSWFASNRGRRRSPGLRRRGLGRSWPYRSGSSSRSSR